jgi:hypothetical protein
LETDNTRKLAIVDAVIELMREFEEIHSPRVPVAKDNNTKPVRLSDLKIEAAMRKLREIRRYVDEYVSEECRDALINLIVEYAKLMV